MSALSRIPNLIVVMSGLLLAGGADAAHAQRRVDSPTNIQAAKTPDARVQQPESQMLNTSESRPVLSTRHVLRAEQDTGPASPGDREIGACCDDDTGTCTIELEANCPGRFIAGVDCVPDPFTPPCGPPGYGILYAPSQPDNPAWRAEVAAIAGVPCDYWDARVSTPTYADLWDYWCVFTWANYEYADATLFGDTLAAFADVGGTVILGQWTFLAFSDWPSGANASVIVGPEYCPVTVASYSSGGTYAGDGLDCVHATGPVTEYAASYWDEAIPRPGAVTDGTLVESGLPAVIWRADRRVYYSPGNTGGDFTTGDTAQLVANMSACIDELRIGACCIDEAPYCLDEVWEAICSGTFLGHGSECGPDCDDNGVPDACQLEFTDVSLFLAQLLADVPDPVFVCMFDQNGDETLNGSDIPGFVDRLTPSP